MMKNKGIKNIALLQSAIDCNCAPEDFLNFENKVTLSVKHPKARSYLELPAYCDLVSYGNNIVASGTEEYHQIMAEFIGKYPVEHCFETPNVHVLNDALQRKGLRICNMAEYFLPDTNLLRELPCAYKTQILYPEDFKELYTKNWSNALCEVRKELDILAVGAYDGERLIGLAGASADCETMWQIGIDVLPDYRRRGVAAALTSRLALEILEREKVPFYCAAWSNIRSVRNAIKSGFRPAWVQMTARLEKRVDEINQSI